MTTRMESSRNTETQEVTVALSVSDVEARSIYRGGKRAWRPERIRLRWTRDRVNDGAWSDWDLKGSISGPYVTKDGTPFKGDFQSNTERIYGLSNVPEEFKAAILGTRPNGELPGYFRREDDAVELDSTVLDVLDDGSTVLRIVE